MEEFLQQKPISFERVEMKWYEEANESRVKMEWENCADGRRVIHYKMVGIGHGVPPDIDGGSMERIVEFLTEARQ